MQGKVPISIDCRSMGSSFQLPTHRSADNDTVKRNLGRDLPLPTYRAIENAIDHDEKRRRIGHDRSFSCNLASGSNDIFEVCRRRREMLACDAVHFCIDDDDKDEDDQDSKKRRTDIISMEDEECSAAANCYSQRKRNTRTNNTPNKAPRIDDADDQFDKLMIDLTRDDPLNDRNLSSTAAKHFGIKRTHCITNSNVEQLNPPHDDPDPTPPASNPALVALTLTHGSTP